MLNWLFRRCQKRTNNEPYTGKYYVVLIEDNPYKKVEVWINVDKIFKRPPCKGDCFRYDLHRNKKPIHCIVIAICDTEAEARDVARNAYV